MEEAPMVVTAATGALGPVVAKLSTLLLRRHGEYKLRRGTRKDIKLIRSKLKFIHSILWVIWEREDRDAASKELRMEAWRLADDMNDAIDDFILSLKRGNDGKRCIQAKDQPSPFQDLKGRAVDVYERCCSKWTMDSAQTTIISRLFSRKKTTFDDSGRLAKRHRVVDPYVHKEISELVDMEEPRDKLIKHLVGEEESTRELKMACIVGAAGMGKTTLARLVYEVIQDNFQARAFVSVISCRNMMEVLASILQQVAVDTTAVLLDGTQAATKNQRLIDIISSFLKDKRYLVMIDDIWHCEEWETIKKSLPNNYLGSRIVTTSRLNSIANKWRDNFDALVYNIGHFDCWQRRAFSLKMIDMNADMVGEGSARFHPILDMCCGVPLAVVCLFSALAKERERQEQQRVLTHDLQDRIVEQITRNGIQNTPGFEPLVESLELGYNHLPHHMLKTCLLYCSIYSDIYSKNHLVRRWIAEGFVCKEEVAKDYFDELESRGFFTVDDSLHPMMQSYLRWKLREDNFITFSSDVPSSLVGRLCINYWPAINDSVDPLSSIDWHHIRSLVVFEDAERVPYKDLQHLRVLDVQPWRGALENQHLKDMCGLLRLRHLLVSGKHVGVKWNITEMPAEIVRLQYLETLQAIETQITRLPTEIGDLKQLKTLDVSQNEILAELPGELGNLHHILETLIISCTKIGEQAWEIIGQLKKLKTLDVSQNQKLSGIPSVIGELQELNNLNVSGTGITKLPCEIGNLQQLKNLNVSGTGITKLPCQIGNLQHLKNLNMSDTGITELPRQIWNLQRLEILNLCDVSTITALPRDIGRLQHLEMLLLVGTNVRKMPREIGGLKKLKNLDAEIGTLPFEAGQLPKLQGLPECVQRAWKNSDLMSSLAGKILSFETTETYEIGDGGLVVGTKHIHIPQWIKKHFNNIGLLDIRVCKLEEQDLKILREMPNLWSLMLRFEAVPRKPIAISGGGFAKLMGLSVDSRMPRVIFQEGAMPRLKWLMFEFQFYGGPPNTAHPMGIKHLVRLHRVFFKCNEWYQGYSPCSSAMIDVMREEAWEHTNNIVLEVSGEDKEIFPANRIARSSKNAFGDSSSSGEDEIEALFRW